MNRSGFVLALMRVLALCASVCVSVPLEAPRRCTACTTLPGVCGTGFCTNKGVPPNCSYECVCTNGKTGVMCEDNARMPNAAVIREKLQVKINPIESLDIGLFGDPFNPNFFLNVTPEKTTTTAVPKRAPVTTATASAAAPKPKAAPAKKIATTITITTTAAAAAGTRAKTETKASRTSVAAVRSGNAGAGSSLRATDSASGAAVVGVASTNGQQTPGAAAASASKNPSGAAAGAASGSSPASPREVQPPNPQPSSSGTAPSSGAASASASGPGTGSQATGGQSQGGVQAASDGSGVPAASTMPRPVPSLSEALALAPTGSSASVTDKTATSALIDKLRRLYSGAQPHSSSSLMTQTAAQPSGASTSGNASPGSPSSSSSTSSSSSSPSASSSSSQQGSPGSNAGAAASAPAPK